jgi:hypothetical protein
MGIEHEGLSDAEREALADEDLDLTTDLESLVNEDDDDDDDLDPGPVDPSDDSGAATRTGEGEGSNQGQEQGAEAAPETASTASEDDSPTPSFAVAVPDIAKIEQGIETLITERAKLEADYEQGESELSYTEHRAKIRELEDQISDLKADRAEAKAVQRMNEAYEQEWWTREIRSFKREALKSDGVDYDKDARLAAEWDKCVRYLGNDQDNDGKSARWFLEEAHEMVKARFKLGKPEAQPAPTAADRRAMVDEAVAARRNKTGTPPKTLANLPEAGAENDQESEFSHLDNLSGLALERALAKMTPEQQDRYLQG